MNSLNSKQYENPSPIPLQKKMITLTLVNLFIVWYVFLNWLSVKIIKEYSSELSFVKTLFKDKLHKGQSAIFLALLSLFLFMWLLDTTEDKSVLQVTTKDVYYIFLDEEKTMIKMTTGCSICDIRIKFFDISGNLHQRRFKRDDVSYDGGNKVIVYEINRPEGFRKKILGNPANQYRLHLDKEYALWVF